MTVIGSVTYSTGIPTYTVSSSQPGSGSSSGGAATSSGKHGLPTYVAAIFGVLGAFGLIFLLVFCIRRRAVNRRAARRQWWSGVMGSGAQSDASSSRDTDDATAGNASSARSIRSSFGTTFDHSEFSITFDDNVPALPPMVEIRGGPGIVPKGDSSSSGNGQPLSPISPIALNSPALPVPLLVSIENSNVYSDANRRTSAGSSTSAQYLTYDRDGASNHQLLTPGASTPMSVRPFSPTESFAFPSPPREHRSSAWTVATPMPQTAEMSVPQITESLVRTPPHTATYSENPFADAFSVPANSASAEFDAVETVWRPFEQTLQDEMTVCAGDQVKVLAIYDDGWAMIERLGMGKGKGKAEDGKPAVGLIPIDCMRKAEESVSSFLAAKRVSSVDATGYTGMAV
ncbi:hypothetical protein B0H12DRAFT_486530 [Mycena haematopus]|nr:hypothetical protein B0H12DRAFT_486530 [Mycena haematopus]